ncbi:MAG: triphosphoribosyl-dephospho-CoA synthase [Clostridia bacterium]
MYINYNIRGIRGEALDGFPCVFEISLPFFKKCIENGFSQNDASVATLLKIISNIDDTNIITRSDFETLKKMQKKTRGFLKNAKKPLEYIEFSRKSDEEFINLNISPGGSADLLALTLFMYFFEK